MIRNLFNILFLVFSIYSFLKSIFYIKYEIKIENSKAGGIALLFFDIFAIIFSNWIIFFN